MEEDLNGHADAAPTADRLRFSVNLKSRMLSLVALAALPQADHCPRNAKMSKLNWTCLKWTARKVSWMLF